MTAKTAKLALDAADFEALYRRLRRVPAWGPADRRSALNHLTSQEAEVVTRDGAFPPSSAALARGRGREDPHRSRGRGWRSAVHPAATDGGVRVDRPGVEHEGILPDAQSPAPVRLNQGTRVLIGSGRRDGSDTHHRTRSRPPDDAICRRHRAPPSSANSAARTPGARRV
jgi:hypothetical protein